MGFPRLSALPGFAAVVLLPPAPAPVKPDQEESLVPPGPSFLSCAKPAEQLSRTKKVIASNRTIMNEHFMDPCANFFGAECHSVEQLSTADVKRKLAIEQDMGSVVHKSGPFSVFGK